MIMLQNMEGMGNTSDHSSQHKLYTLKKTMINEWSKIPIRDNIHIRTDRWSKTRRIITGYKKVIIYGGPFQRRGTAAMAVDKVSFKAIITVQEFRNLVWWSCMLLRGENNMKIESSSHAAPQKLLVQEEHPTNKYKPPQSWKFKMT